MSAISLLLEGSQRASLNSCRPVSASCAATSHKITVVAAKNLCSGTFRVPLKKNNPTAIAAANPAMVPIQVCMPSLESSTAQNDRQLRAFAQHHEKNKKKNPRAR